MFYKKIIYLLLYTISRMRFTYNTKDHGNNIMFCRDLTMENVN